MQASKIIIFFCKANICFELVIYTYTIPTSQTGLLRVSKYFETEHNTYPVSGTILANWLLQKDEKLGTYHNPHHDTRAFAACQK